MSLSETRSRASADIRRQLGLEDLTSARLLDLSRAELGDDRTERLLGLARAVPLTSRAQALASIAALIVGTRQLGIRWWGQGIDRLGGISPDDAVAALIQPDLLDRLAKLVEDNAADETWGVSIGFVDLNDAGIDDRVALPVDARIDSEYVAAFDPGCRVVVTVVNRSEPPTANQISSGTRRGPLGSRLGETLFHPTADAEWAWAVATDTGPILLPGEVNGRDPFSAKVEPEMARFLTDWALTHGVSETDAGVPWITKADLWAARCRLEPYARPGGWFAFDRAVAAVVDESSDVAERLATLAHAT